MLENDTYILEKLLGNILILSRNAGKTFTDSCNNPAKGGSSSTDVMKENIYKFNLLGPLLGILCSNKHLSCIGVKVSKRMRTNIL